MGVDLRQSLVGKAVEVCAQVNVDGQAPPHAPAPQARRERDALSRRGSGFLGPARTRETELPEAGLAFGDP